MNTWMEALKKACDETSQAEVARTLGRSPAQINQVIKGTYNADLTRIEEAVRGAFMHETVACPVLGELEKHRCQEEQKKTFIGTSPLRIQIYRACRTCPHFKRGK